MRRIQIVKKTRTVLFLLGTAVLCLLCRHMSGRENMRVLEYKEGMYYAMARQVFSVNTGDSFYEHQWALKNSGNLRRISYEVVPDFWNQGPGRRTGTDYSLENHVTDAVEGIDIGIEQAWEVYERSTERRLVTVALIDTGVDISHPDLAASLWVNEDEIAGDGIDNDNNGYMDDIHGWNFYSRNSQVFEGQTDDHGTHGAGTIAGVWDGQGITGIADGTYVKLMILKALGTEYGMGDSESVKQAIRYAEANGADICNLSIGTLQYDEEMEHMIRESSMLFVVSAGNGNSWGRGYDIDQWPIYPACYDGDNIITVGNLLFDGTLSESSNYGARSVDIAAPGTYILSSVPGGYAYMSGTSMAAPMVSGTAALVYSCRMDLNLMDVKEAILNTARALDGLSGKTATGGMLNAYGAITYQK